MNKSSLKFSSIIIYIMTFKGGSGMSDKKYLSHLMSTLDEHKRKVLKQEGGSDIESFDYHQKFEKWYMQIIDYINKNPPEYYVKSINVTQDSGQLIKSINYNYCTEFEHVDYVAINIFWE